MIPGTFWFTPNTMMHQLGQDMVDEEAYKAQLDTPAGRHAEAAREILVDMLEGMGMRADAVASGALSTAIGFAIIVASAESTAIPVDSSEARTRSRSAGVVYTSIRCASLVSTSSAPTFAACCPNSRRKSINPLSTV